MNKRSFLKQLSFFGLGGMAYPGLGLDELLKSKVQTLPQDLAVDEEFWMQVRRAYKLKPDYINLENGYYNFLPEEVLEKYIQHLREVNYQGAYYMRTVQWENKARVAKKLADQFGAAAEELVITRNTTESLDLIISGYPWQTGDEVIFATHDYSSIMNMFELTARRKGFNTKVLQVPLHPASDEAIVSLYEAAITAQTKLIMVSHMVNITGQILPIRKICDMAHSHGVEVMVDGAHAIAHIQFSIRDLHCDYYGSSLHKWLGAPLGAGLLYVQQDKTDKIWPLLAPYELDREGIANLNHVGTHPVATDLAIAAALDFYQQLGPERKEARLRYLQQYWTEKVRGIEGIKVNTPAQAERACAIANVGIEGLPPAEMAKTLLETYGIYTVAIAYAGVQGCRITPNVYTTPRELDQLVVALKEMALSGI
ncbi:aminotransferase class V-fold PLP-dependent enzyme [Pararhodonellum marinum]|uniref:aminotransferase class V-fold PLP-dependent enzyme n=1 Tax=Pararhodonellum marinum TaxID=2755358 RepID=UPI00188FC0FD|nr:aminotransferase class V-fold PLP-dependent enzyme [Pararhodonellum marinum]